MQLSWTGVLAVDGLANALLFVPLTVFAAVATRRPVAVGSYAVATPTSSVR